MRKKRGFTLVEILIVLLMLGLLATLAIFMYNKSIEKAKSAEAIIAVGHIRDAEVAKKWESGEYIAAEDTGEVNALLGLGVLSKDFEYRVVGVTEDNFLVLAHRIDEEIKAGKFSPESIVVAMDKDGIVNYPSGPVVATGGGTGGGGTGGYGGGGTAGGGGGGIGGGTGGGSSGGGATGGYGGGPETGSGTSDTIASATSSGGGGWSNLAIKGGSGAEIDPGLQDVIDLLKNSSYATYAYDLIQDKKITVTFAVLPSTVGASWSPGRNTISVNNSERNNLTSALAALIAHEATHADYFYFPDFWRITTLNRYPGLTTVSIPGNSINQEYDCFANQVKTWQELKSGADTNNDTWLSIYNQGEEFMKAEIKSTYAAGGQNLPDF